jgi:hypothetical protein
MRNYLCAGLVLIFMAGCKSKIPADIIQPEKMQGILYDIHVIDGYVSTLGTNSDSAKRIAAAYYKGVYTKFEIDSVHYAKSMTFYYDHPEILTGMYDQVNNGLKKSKDSLEKAEAERIANLSAAQKKAKKLADDKKMAASAKKLKDSLDKVNRINAERVLNQGKKGKDSLNKARRLRKNFKTLPVEKVN